MDTVTNIYSRAKWELESARRSLVDSNIIDNRVKVVNQQKLWNGVAKKMQSITSTIKEMNVYYKVF